MDTQSNWDIVNESKQQLLNGVNMLMMEPSTIEKYVND